MASNETVVFDLQLFAGERTEAPTPKRREQARQRGNVFRSPEFSAACALLAVIGVLEVLGPGVVRGLALWAQGFWSQPVRDWSPADLQGMGLETALAWGRAVAPVIGAAVAAGMLVQVLQSRPAFSFSGLVPRLENLSPVRAWQRFFSVRAAAELIKSLVKLAILSAVAYSVLSQAVPGLKGLSATDPLGAVRSVMGWVERLSWRMVLALVAVAVADHFYQRWEYERSLRMSRQEVMEEARETEGDPHIRARRRKRQRELARMAMMREVPRAQVVIANPDHYAVALRYVPEEMEAPVVVAKGKGYLAQRIKEIARQHGVTIVEEPPLARALYRMVDVGRAIPEELYQAVAEVLAFVWRLKGRL